MPADAVVMYLLGGAMVVMGIQIISRQSFPRWVKGMFLWPLIRITPEIATLQGWAGVTVGAAAISYTFARFEPAAQTWFLGFAGLSVASSLVLVIYSTWLSRRPEPGAMPPRP